MRDLVRVEFECERCGGSILTVQDDLSNDSVVSCKSCGHIRGTFGDLKKEIVRDALYDIVPQVYKALNK